MPRTLPAEGADKTQVVVHPSDYIYSSDDFAASPIVLEQPYNLVFFPVSGVADTAFRCLLRRLLNLENWKDTTQQLKGLRYLSDYSVDEASQIMSSPTYTRAMFVRDPLERLQATYKLMLTSHEMKLAMISRCDCARDCWYLSKCKDQLQTFQTFVRDLVGMCDEPFWRPQARRMEPRFYDTLDFIGMYESIVTS